jgi:hypothetical protein
VLSIGTYPLFGELYGRGDHGARMLGAQASPQRLTAPVGGVAALEVVCTRTNAPLRWRSMYIQLVHRPLHPKWAHDPIGSGQGSIASAHPRTGSPVAASNGSKRAIPLRVAPMRQTNVIQFPKQQPEGERLRLYRDEPCTILVLSRPRASRNGALLAKVSCSYWSGP